jgi:hypothetical protein
MNPAMTAAPAKFKVIDYGRQQTVSASDNNSLFDRFNSLTYPMSPQVRLKT